MKTYGLKKKDRIICGKKGCTCGDTSSKHPKNLKKDYNMTKRLKKSARQESKKDMVSHVC